VRSIASLQVDKLSSSRLGKPKLRGKDRDRREPLACGLGSSSSTKVFRTTLDTLQLEKPTQHPGSWFGAGGMVSSSAALDHGCFCTGQPNQQESSNCQTSGTKFPGGTDPKEAGSMHRGVQHGDSVSAGVGDSSSSLSSSRDVQRLMLPRSRGSDLQRRLAAGAEPGDCQNVFRTTRRGTGAIPLLVEQIVATSLPLALAVSASPAQVLLSDISSALFRMGIIT
jgi:hypothetical protein